VSASDFKEIERLPGEDLDAGLYIHPGHPDVATVTIDGETRYLVDAREFMAMQKERDDYRRTLALVNECRLRGYADRERLDQLLEKAGFSYGEAEAMSSLLAEVATWPRG
jgi:hypothetical protein